MLLSLATGGMTSFWSLRILPGLLLVVGGMVMPGSPRYLVAQGKVQEALRMLKKLRGQERGFWRKLGVALKLMNQKKRFEVRLVTFLAFHLRLLQVPRSAPMKRTQFVYPSDQSVHFVCRTSEKNWLRSCRNMRQSQAHRQAGESSSQETIVPWKEASLLFGSIQGFERSYQIL